MAAHRSGARTLPRADVLILDEPTSAMDPWAEADWMDRFRAMTPIPPAFRNRFDDPTYIMNAVAAD